MTEWWRDAVIYQIYPRCFQDSDGDGIGDLKGITRRLDHVASLGVDAIWLSPFFTSPMKDMGYDVSDYTGIDPLFGTMDDFDALVAEAHRAGAEGHHRPGPVAHLGPASLVRGQPRSRDQRQAPTGMSGPIPSPTAPPPNNWLSIFGGPAWDWEPRRRQYYLHNFLTEQPDLNFHEPRRRRTRCSTRCASGWTAAWTASGSTPSTSTSTTAICATTRPPRLDRRPGPLQLRSTIQFAKPAREHRVSQADARADGRIRRPHDGRRGRRRPRPDQDHGRLHLRRRQAAHGLHLRVPGHEVQRRAFPRMYRGGPAQRRRRPAAAGASRTTTSCATSPAGTDGSDPTPCASLGGHAAVLPRHDLPLSGRGAGPARDG